VFDWFYRVERGDARETYGYGLGLYIARRLVELMGGRIWVESQVGKGSCFSFALPKLDFSTSQLTEESAPSWAAEGVGERSTPRYYELLNLPLD